MALLAAAAAAVVATWPTPAAAQAPTLDCGKVAESLPDQFPAWSDGSGWEDESHYSTIQTADIDGDGKDELMGRGPHGLVTNHFDDGQWVVLDSQGPFGGGWDDPSLYSTIQFGDIDGDRRAEMIGRGRAGVDTFRWDRQTLEWIPLDVPARGVMPDSRAGGSRART